MVYFRKSFLHGKTIEKSVKGNDPKLEYFKKLVNAHLNELENKENAEKSDIKKSILEAESMQKSSYPVGTIREWKGKKYIKVAPGKWRPKYESNSRGAKMSIAALRRKADKCTSSEELMQLILENRERFSDENGRPLPFVKELSDYVSAKNDNIERENVMKQDKITKEEAEKHKVGRTLSQIPTKELHEEKRKLERWVANKTHNKRDSLNNSIFRDSNKHQLDLVNAELEKRRSDRKSDVKHEGEYVLTKSGSKDFGKITPEISKKIGRQAGKIRLRIGKENGEKSDYGEKHIERESRMKQIIKAGFKTVRDFIEYVCSDFDEIYNNGMGLILAKKNEKNKSIAYVQLTPSEDGDFYDVKTATLSRPDFKKNETPLWSKSDNGVQESKSERAQSNQLNNESPLRGLSGDSDNSNIPQNEEKSSGITEIRKKYESFKSVTGNKKTVTLPDGTKIKCHYKIVEADAPSASHDEGTFAPSKGFPTTKDGKSVNDRDYQNDADAQESVRKIANNFNSLSLESPPIVTKDGIVISGNNRTMSSKLAAKQGTDKAYLQDLHDMADEYGIEPEDLNGFENPRLILETDDEHEGDYTTEEFAKFNRDTKKTMNNVEKAVKLTKTLNAEKIQSIAESLQGYDTMGELYADTKGSQEFVNKLITAGIIGENEKAQYCRTDGTLNDSGKEFCETVLVGSVLNENNIRKLDGVGGKRIRQKCVRAILPLIENKGTGKEYSFNTELNDAVNIAVTVAKDHDTFPDVKTYLAQGNLFGEKAPDAATSRLAEIIHDEGEKAFAQRMKDLGAGLRDSAAGKQDIFLGGVESKESLLDRFLEIKKSIAGILSKIAKKEQSASELVASVLNNI